MQEHFHITSGGILQNYELLLTDWPSKWVRHQGMARPQIAGGGTACNAGGSCEYIE